MGGEYGEDDDYEADEPESAEEAFVVSWSSGDGFKLLVFRRDRWGCIDVLGLGRAFVKSVRWDGTGCS